MNIETHVAALYDKYPGEFENLSLIQIVEDDDIVAIAYNKEQEAILYNPHYVTEELAETCLAFMSRIMEPAYFGRLEEYNTHGEKHRWNIASHLHIVENMKLMEDNDWIFPDNMVIMDIDAAGKTVDEIYELVNEEYYENFTFDADEECDEDMEYEHD